MTMIANPSGFNHIVAFEVSKATLVVHVLPADTQRSIAKPRCAGCCVPKPIATAKPL